MFPLVCNDLQMRASKVFDISNIWSVFQSPWKLGKNSMPMS
jgi:hypothetical protein